MYELIITEKPQAAQKIAYALAEDKPIKRSIKGVPYYELKRKGKQIIVACAVGHLYGLDQKEGTKKWDFPIFDVEWQPTHETKKQADFTRKYLEAIKKLCKKASEFTVACDYDAEGSVIGANIIRFACKQKDAARMKFSTLTKEDLIEAYENKSKTLDWEQVRVGETRHYLDWFYGINYSRALTSSIKKAGAFKIMSTGRVQGPALKIIVDREKEIKDFKAKPFWQIQLLGKVKGEKIEAWHKENKFWEKEKADKIVERTKSSKEGKVESLEKKQFNNAPPIPFDLTTLQVEAYRCFGIQPRDTLAIAQDLYTGGFISYPRTSSQQLPPKIGYSKILSLLKKQEKYAGLCSELLKKQLRPNNGKKTDPAHPAIYPTGVIPNLGKKEMKIYDLIVRRFMATFAEPALRESAIININVNDEIFIAKGTRTIKRGWHVYYEPYLKLEEVELPSVNKGDTVKIEKINLLEKKTQPPKRYTPASIIRELEKRGLGTKATRAQIIDTLFQRGYIEGRSIKATELGIKTAEALEKYVPKIVDEELTRHFENEMEEIREGKKQEDIVLKEAKNEIIKIIEDFKKKEKEIGNELLEAHKETRDRRNNLGKCPLCDDGKLMIKKGKFGYFAACTNYPECKIAISLPNNAKIVASEKRCDICGYPMVKKILKRRKAQEFCLNPNCDSKKADDKAESEARDVADGKIEKICPKCGGKMVLRSSIYGRFFGCSNYPKCKHTEKLENNKNK